MTDKTAILRAFNTHLFNFLDDIIGIYPDNEELKYARTSFDTIKRANPTLIVKVWYTFIYTPYKPVIDAGNIEFFFEKDYGSDLLNVANSKEIMGIIDKIREPIRGMDAINRAHSAKYIKNLSQMSTMYNDMTK
jgi:hypothetical protein